MRVRLLVEAAEALRLDSRARFGGNYRHGGDYRSILKAAPVVSEPRVTTLAGQFASVTISRHLSRHRFATHTLGRWYRAHQDPECEPLLSAYLGHVHVAEYQWYLSGSPELMREAMRRLEHRWEDRPRLLRPALLRCWSASSPSA